MYVLERTITPKIGHEAELLADLVATLPAVAAARDLPTTAFRSFGSGTVSRIRLSTWAPDHRSLVAAQARLAAEAELVAHLDLARRNHVAAEVEQIERVVAHHPAAASTSPACLLGIIGVYRPAEVMAAIGVASAVAAKFVEHGAASAGALLSSTGTYGQITTTATFADLAALDAMSDAFVMDPAAHDLILRAEQATHPTSTWTEELWLSLT